jgi:hypothetical protein
VEDGAADITTAHRHRHLDGAGGELGVVMLRQPEADDASRRQVLDGRHLELALVDGDLGPVTAPLPVDGRRREVPFDQVRN